jgi:hypothetical protein
LDNVNECEIKAAGEHKKAEGRRQQRSDGNMDTIYVQQFLHRHLMMTVTSSRAKRLTMSMNLRQRQLQQVQLHLNLHQQFQMAVLELQVAAQCQEIRIGT